MCQRAPGWTLGVVNFSEKVLDSLDLCYHPDEDQILISIYPNISSSSIWISIDENQRTRCECVFM